MALRKVYIGSVGPFIYDDTDLVDDPDGDFSGYTQKSVLTDGPVEGAPVTSKPAQGAITNAVTSHSVSDWATTNSALDALGSKINEILAALRGYGVIAT